MICRMLAVDSLMPSVQQWLIIAAVAGLLIALWLMSRRRRPLDGSPTQYRREIDSAVAQGEAVNHDLRELLAELEKLSRRINGQFDARVAEMQQILAEADQRIAELRSLIDESRRLAEPASEVSSRRPQSERPADQTHAPVVPPSPETLEAARSPKGPPSVQAASPPSPAVDPRGRIYAFADEGLTPVQIAQRTGRPVGEVELILNLRRAVAAEPGRKP